MLALKAQEESIVMNPQDVVEFKELLLANTIQIDTMYQLLIH
jgi:hypothetical protein